MKSIYILSLPRSGSTLLQRILATSSEVVTISEPWVLLPVLYPLRNRIYAPYGHRDYEKASKDFFKEINSDELVEELVSAVEKVVYSKLSTPQSKYYLDKTPRYLHIADDLTRICSANRKIIVLTRNPIAVINSISNTWARGGWNFYKYQYDLVEGAKKISEICDSENIIKVKYEDLVSRPDVVVARLAEFLGVDFESYTEFNKVELSGRMGDPTGVVKFQVIENKQHEDLSGAVCNSFRRTMLRKYISEIGFERIIAIGYEPNSLLSYVDSQSVFLQKKLVRDMLSMVMSIFYRYLQPRVIADAVVKILKRKKVYILR